MKVKDKVIVVTGAGSGIGRELTIQLTRKGAKVALVDINEKALDETMNLCQGARTSKHVLSVSDRKSVEELPEAIIELFGAVDGVINNAGIIQPFVDVNSLDYETIERVMNINFYGALYMTKTFLPHLLKRPEAHIVNVSSMGGFMPFPEQTIYGSSKAAMKLMTEGLFAELMDTTVHVTIIYPGAVNTNIMVNSGLITEEEAGERKSEGQSKALPAEEAAEIMINGIEKNKFRILVGKDSRILDRWYRISPKRAIKMIVNQVSKMNSD